MPRAVKWFGSAVALAATLTLAACVTSAPPAPTPIPAGTFVPVPATTLTPTPTPAPMPMPTPAPLPEGVAFTQMAVGQDHFCGLTADGLAFCWGRNDAGQLDVPGGTRFRQLAAGYYFSCGLRLDGALTCWGDVPDGWLGDEPGNWALIRAWVRQFCALDADGAVACWGADALPPEEGRYTTIDMGHGYGCGLTRAGDLECWGDGTLGRYDRGQSQSRTGPFTALAVGYRHMCVLRPDGSPFCQGYSAYGQADPPDAIFTRIGAGRDHSCGITDAGDLVCWGTRETPPAGSFTTLFSGTWGTCALRPDGLPVCQTMHGGKPPWNVEPALEGRAFERPVESFPWPGGGLAVVERRGAVTVHAPERPPRLVLDLTDRTTATAELGLLGATLAPDFDASPHLYLWYSKAEADGSATGRLSRFTIADGRADAESEVIVLDVPGQLRYRVGGALRFGPDGMLYLGIGDYQLREMAQDPGDLRGKIIRIDVRGGTADAPYRIPDDNPFLATPGARPEIWARGLREPWRMSFDAEGGLWVADVGARAQEEISLVTPGANLGWPVFEGTYCRGEGDACAALVDATFPVTAYNHDLGCAIIGGVHVLPNGPYLFGDYCSGRVWALEDGGGAVWEMREIAHAGYRIIAFGTGVDGEVHVLTEDGPILRLVASP